MMLKENNILCFGEIVLGYLDRDDLLPLTRMKNSAPISLIKPQFRMIINITTYYNFMYRNGDRAFIDDLTQWDTKNFED